MINNAVLVDCQTNKTYLNRLAAGIDAVAFLCFERVLQLNNKKRRPKQERGTSCLAYK